MAYIEGLITRITTGSVLTETETYTAFTGEYNLDAGGVGNITADKEVVLDNPEEPAKESLSNDYVPIVSYDTSREPLGCTIIKSDKPKTTKLSDYLDDDKKNQPLAEFQIESDSIILNFTVKKGSSKADDDEGYVTAKSSLVKFVGADNNVKIAKPSIKLEQKYGSNFTLKIYANGEYKNNTIIYVDFYADDNDMMFFSVSNVFCGRIALIYKESLFKKIYANYPKPYVKKPCTDGYYDQCAIRMSIALMGAGISLDGVQNLTNPGGKTYCSHNHVLGSYNLSRYMDKLKDKVWFNYELMDGTKVDARSKVLGKKGILYFENFEEPNPRTGIMGRSNQYRHIEVWNGAILVSGFDGQMFKATIIKFWEIR